MPVRGMATETRAEAPRWVGERGMRLMSAKGRGWREPGRRMGSWRLPREVGGPHAVDAGNRQPPASVGGHRSGRRTQSLSPAGGTSPSLGRLIEDPRRRPDTVNYPDGASCVPGAPLRAAGELRAHAIMSGIPIFRRGATLPRFVAVFGYLESPRPRRVTQAGNGVTRVGENRYPTPNIRCTIQNIRCTGPERLARRVPATTGRRTEAIGLQAADALRRNPRGCRSGG